MAVELKSTLDGTQTEFKPNHAYLVDFSKLGSVNDLIMVLSAMGISFPSEHPLINELKPFLNLDNPFPLQQPNNSDIEERIFKTK